MCSNIYFFDTLPSTNDKAKELAKNGAPDGTTVIAKTQTEGRGRKGRQFISQEGGLYMSIVLRPSLPIDASVSLTISAAVAVQKAILSCYGIDTEIKWVNDLYYHKKKFCGILAEGFDITASAEEKPRFGFVILGIGINLSENLIFPEELKNIAGTLGTHFENDTDFHENTKKLASAITNNIIHEISSMETNFARGNDLFSNDFIDYYNKHFIWAEKYVTAGSVHGIAKGITQTGGLIIITQDKKKEIITSGEISLLPG